MIQAALHRMALAGALLVVGAAAPASAQDLLMTCHGSSANGQGVSQLFTVPNDHLGYRGSGMFSEDVSAYGLRAGIPQLVANYSRRSLPAQFDAFMRTQPRGHNGGTCVAATDRALISAYYRRLIANGHNKFLLNDWRPTSGTALRAEEWPN